MNKLFAAVLSRKLRFLSPQPPVPPRCLSNPPPRFPTALVAVLPQRIRKRKPPPYIPLRKSVPPQRAAPTAAILRGTAPDTASAPRLLPPEKAKAPPEPRENVKAPANRTARAVPGRGKRRRQPWTRRPRGRRAGKRSRTGPGSRITPLWQKKWRGPCRGPSGPGGIQQKMLVFL